METKTFPIVYVRFNLSYTYTTRNLFYCGGNIRFRIKRSGLNFYRAAKHTNSHEISTLLKQDYQPIVVHCFSCIFVTENHVEIWFGNPIFIKEEISCLANLLCLAALLSFAQLELDSLSLSGTYRNVMWNFLSLRPNGLNARKESSVKLRVVISQCGPSYLVWSLHKQFTSPASSTVHVPRLLQIASGQVPAGNGGWQVPLPTGNSSEEYLVWLS